VCILKTFSCSQVSNNKPSEHIHTYDKILHILCIFGRLLSSSWMYNEVKAVEGLNSMTYVLWHMLKP
jgi:hypothetical protein